MTDTAADTLRRLRATFDTGRTADLGWRRRQLGRLAALLEENERLLIAALARDLGKPAFDAWLADLLTTRDEAAHALRHLDTWARPARHQVPVLAQPGRAWTEPHPIGVVLVIAPWNYPVQLLLGPLVGVLAAGNCAVLKPSELAPATSALLAELVARYLDPDAVAVVEGGVDVTTALLAEPFDHILFTGSTRVGQIVMAAAAKNLTPVTLELGGKSPTIVAADADLGVAARRIAWAKQLNAGQTCIAPDYVLVERGCQAAFTDALSSEVARFRDNGQPTSIVNEVHLDRLKGLLDGHGGHELTPRKVDLGDRTMAPVVILDPDPAAPVMTEEIFGPILPVVTVDSVDDAIEFVRTRPRPLALYLFTSSPVTERLVLDRIRAGSVCVNHLIYQFTCPDLPFGGIGPSGMGSYHGKAGFDAFSHHTPVLRRTTRLDHRVLYPPYPRAVELLLRRVLRWPAPRRQAQRSGTSSGS
jgi:aldehyde dehydrogenase (NAD+)